jgi:hypothetical protein
LASASTVGEFTAALADSWINKILLAAGTYELTSDMCTGSAICIDRALTIEAQVPGSVVLDAKGGRRVFEIQSSGTAELVGLNITGGYASVPRVSPQGGGVYVASNGVANFEGCNIHDNTANYVCLHLELSLNFHPSPQWYAHCWRCIVAGQREFCAELNPRM